MSVRGAESGRALRFADVQHARDRFLRFVPVKHDGQCWLWTGGLRTKGGYGCFGLSRGLVVQAHRASVAILREDVPYRSVVRHTCHTKACVNPAHLILGSQLDNRRDDVVRGAARGVPGNRHNARLSDGDVREMRERRKAGELLAALATSFGVSQATVSNVANGLIYRGVA